MDHVAEIMTALARVEERQEHLVEKVDDLHDLVNRV